MRPVFHIVERLAEEPPAFSLAVKPARLGITRWPTIAPGRPWKQGICAALGVAEPADMWRLILSRDAGPETSVRTSADPIAHPDAQSVRDARSRRGLPEGVSR